MTTFVSATLAEQHLTELGDLDAHYSGGVERGRTLCGLAFSGLPVQVRVWDHRDGFDDKRPACEVCADRADAIQNGGR